MSSLTRPFDHTISAHARRIHLPLLQKSHQHPNSNQSRVEFTQDIHLKTQHLGHPSPSTQRAQTTVLYIQHSTCNAQAANKPAFVCVTTSLRYFLTMYMLEHITPLHHLADPCEKWDDTHQTKRNTIHLSNPTPARPSQATSLGRPPNQTRELQGSKAKHIGPTCLFSTRHSQGVRPFSHIISSSHWFTGPNPETNQACYSHRLQIRPTGTRE